MAGEQKEDREKLKVVTVVVFMLRSTSGDMDVVLRRFRFPNSCDGNGSHVYERGMR